MNFFRKAKPSLTALFRSKRPLSSQFQYSPSPPYSTLSSKPFLFGKANQWRRFYYADRQQLQHFSRRGGGGGRHWYQNPRTVLAVTIIGGGAVITIYYGNLETVPYTKRSHFVLLSPAVERQLGESQFEQLKSALRGKILPPIHPDSVRVRLISKDIIEALQRGLRHDERRWSDLEYAPESPTRENSSDSFWGLEEKGSVEGRWSREDEVLDDRWVHQCRKAGEARGSQPATGHLEGLNWEVLVVRDDAVNALCLPGGKIVVFTGLLDHFRTDAEIATVIGHEVGHAIARHAAESITKNLWFALLQLILLQFFFMPDLISAMSNLLLRLPFSRRMEMEADYIGLLLLASAGYDPRVAPRVYEKLGQITGDSALKDYLSTHPSSKKRSQLLSQAQVMEEALTIYRETIAGRGVAGFL